MADTPNLPVPRGGGALHRRLHIEVQGVERVDAAFAAIIAKTSEVTGLMVHAALERVADLEKANLTLGWHPKGTRTGSVPPAPPWRISGHLMRSVTVDPPRLRNFKWSGRMGPTAVYARIHELGGVIHQTRTRTIKRKGLDSVTETHAVVINMPPRPHLRPAWMVARPWVETLFEHGWSFSTRPPRYL